MENMNTDVRVSRVDFPLPPTPFSLPLHNGIFIYIAKERR